MRGDAANEPPVGRGEPLLITDWVGDKALVLRADGRTRYVATALLGTMREGAAFPSAAYAPKPHDAVTRAIDDAGESDEAELVRHREQVVQFEACAGVYLEKHDPTWGTGATVFRLRGRHVENVGAALAKRAESSCGLARLEAADARLSRVLNGTRTARWAAVFAAASARFAR